MSLNAGARLGPYEIVAPLGAGGMGEVYRAKDTRLDRTVALKILPEDFLKGEESRQRFEREARTLASLNHPNIAVLYAFEEAKGRHLLAMELLEGETLREKLGSPLPPKKAAEYAVQVAQGLAAAHEKGIVHRDLKPENLFVTRDGRIKILDFGIAKLTQPAVPFASLTQAPTSAPPTDAGVILGTVGYMSPEQVMGKALDARTDLFSLGVVLYEMLAGKRPFQRQTAPETLVAILREDPPELSVTNKPIPPGLERIVRHCLEKDPGNRFQSARDIAFALESLSQSSTAGTAPLRSTNRRRRLAAGALAAVVLAAAGAGLFGWGKRSARAAPWPTFKRLTFRRGIQGTTARFTPDYQSIVYSARWEDKPFFELFVQRLASADARSLGLGGEVAGTVGGDVAIVRKGILAQLPLEGGTPRELLKDVREANWDPTGSKFAVVRAAGARWRLEYPAGKVLVETTGLESLSLPRVSPDGTRVAFLLRDGYGGAVCMVDLSGQGTTLSKGLIEVWGLVWSPDGQEIWFSAARAGTRQALYAVALSGRERLVANFPGSFYIRDIAPDGRVLLKYGLARRHELRGRLAGDAAERDLSWLDGTSEPKIAPDGTQMLFQEWGEGGFRPEDPRGGGVESSIYHWRSDGSAPKRLGPGIPLSVSPDWTTALVQTGGGAKKELNLVPIGPGETTTLARGPIQNYVWGSWHPDGKRIVVKGTDAEGLMRLYVQDISGGLPRPFGRFVEDGADPFSRDGRYIATRQKEGEPYVLCPIDGGETHPIPFLKVEDYPLVFGDDGKSLFVAANSGWPVRVQRIELQTGKREPWLELMPPDRAGVGPCQRIDLTPNGRFYSYGYWRALSDLYLVEGLK